MASTIVKLPLEAHAKLQELANADERPMSEVLASLIEQERRRRLFDEGDAAYDRLRANPEAWAAYQDELASMEGTLMDGLEDHPWVE